MRLIRCDYPGCGKEAPERFWAAWVQSQHISEELRYTSRCGCSVVHFDVCDAHRDDKSLARAAEFMAHRIAKEGK